MRNTSARRRCSCSSRRPPDRHGARAASIALLILVSASAVAQTEIYRCVQEDGTVSFQETPCPEPASEAGADEQASTPAPVEDPAVPADDPFASPFDETDEPVVETRPAEPRLPLPSEDRTECEKLTRDAIDAIDLELQKGYSEEERQAYADELLRLTRQLRACKAL